MAADGVARDECVVLVLHRGIKNGKPDGHQAQPFDVAAREGGTVGADGAHYRLVLRDAREQPAKLDAIRATKPGIIVDFRHWSECVDDLRRDIRSLRAEAPDAAYVLMDYYAQSSSPHLPVIDLVDVYAKRQVLRDRARYSEDLAGGYVVTDFLARELGFDIGSWHFGAIVAPREAVRIEPVWNLGASPRYRRLLDLSAFAPPSRYRPIRFNIRIGLKQRTSNEEWYQTYRRMCLDAMLAAAPGTRTSGVQRVGVRRYFAEMLASRAVFSPFGWGEVCFRDYEAVACGCLLIKQDMSHLATEPDIFAPMETYVPIRWDLQDLPERVAWIDSHPREAARIATAGRAALARYFFDRGGLRTVCRLLDLARARRAGLSGSQAAG